MHFQKYALVCHPGDTVDRGLRMNDLGQVDVSLLKDQHRTYCRVLEELGFTLLEMSPDNIHPDSVFVEDPAVIINSTLISTRLRCVERQGEEETLKNKLLAFFSDITQIEPPGYVEGGDVLVTNDRLYIGLSNRTDHNGAEQLARLARDRQGYSSEVFEIPAGYLHLKGEATFHRYTVHDGKNVITASEEIASYFEDSGCKLIVTPASERFGGNCISENGRIIIHAGRPRTRRLLVNYGFDVREIPMSEFEKIDGALTCLSKLFLR
jgi:dimethylargininase